MSKVSRQDLRRIQFAKGGLTARVSVILCHQLEGIVARLTIERELGLRYLVGSLYTFELSTERDAAVGGARGAGARVQDKLGFI